MDECSVALKISRFVKDLLTSLLNEGNTSQGTQGDQATQDSMPGVMFNDFTNFFPGFPGEIRTDYGTANIFEEGLLDFTFQ